MKQSRLKKTRRKEFLQEVEQSEEDYYKFLRERVKEARKGMNMTQATLGKAIFKSRVIVSDLERGRTQIGAADLMRIAQVLEKPIKYFFPIRDVPSEEELTTDEWEIVIQFRKLANHPDLRKLALDEMKKLGEVAQVKEKGIGIALLENLLADGEETRNQPPAELEKLRKMLEQAKKK